MLLAHAVVIQNDSPFAPISNATFPVAIFAIAIGIYIGDTLSGPFSNKVCALFSIVCSPPIPALTATPNLVLSILDTSKLASFINSLSAINAKCEYLSSLFASLLSK